MVIPKETLTKLGFKTLDLMYGELTIKKGIYYDEVFGDKDGNPRLGYKNIGLKEGNNLGYLYKDREFFLNIIPVEDVDYERVLRDWFEERYKREVDTTGGIVLYFAAIDFETPQTEGGHII